MCQRISHRQLVRVLCGWFHCDPLARVGVGLLVGQPPLKVSSLIGDRLHDGESEELLHFVETLFSGCSGRRQGIRDKGPGIRDKG